MDENDLPLFQNPANESTEADPVQPEGQCEPSFGKYIVYVDESGDHGMTAIDPDYPIFVLAFCIFHKRHYAEKVIPALESFKFKHFGHDQLVLHEHGIRKEKSPFRIFPNKKAKAQFLDDLTSIVQDSNFILASCVIEKKRMQNTAESHDNLYHLALIDCVLNLYDFLVEKGEQDHTTHVVVEKRGKKEDKELELEFFRICDGKNPRGLQLPFKILFSDKKAMSSGLQLADLVARPVGLHVLRPDQPNRAFDALKAKFFCKGGRAKVGEEFDGLGLKIVPSRKSEGAR